MFDIVQIPCPKCGHKVAFQSKGGYCAMQIYDLEDAPPKVLADLAGDTPPCGQCSCLVGVRMQVVVIPYIAGEACPDE